MSLFHLSISTLCVECFFSLFFSSLFIISLSFPFYLRSLKQTKFQWLVQGRRACSPTFNWSYWLLKEESVFFNCVATSLLIILMGSAHGQDQFSINGRVIWRLLFSFNNTPSTFQHCEKASQWRWDFQVSTHLIY